MIFDTSNNIVFSIQLVGDECLIYDSSREAHCLLESEQNPMTNVLPPIIIKKGIKVNAIDLEA